MGSSASKPARAAAGAVKRQYPKQAAPPPRPPATAPKETRAPEPPTPPPAPSPPPSQAPGSPAPQGPTYHSKEQPSSFKSNAIDLDGRDPDFAASLRSIGPVNPSPTFSHSSTVNRGSVQTVFPTAHNPALLAVKAREQITKAAQQEIEQMGRQGFAGRQFLDALTIHQALSMRDLQGMPRAQIERTLGVKKGTIDRLGKDGLVARVS